MSYTVVFIVFKDLRRVRRGRDRMAVGYTTTYAISVVSSNLDQCEIYNIM